MGRAKAKPKEVTYAVGVVYWHTTPK